MRLKPPSASLLSYVDDLFWIDTTCYDSFKLLDVKFDVALCKPQVLIVEIASRSITK